MGNRGNLVLSWDLAHDWIARKGLSLAKKERGKPVPPYAGQKSKNLIKKEEGPAWQRG